MVWHDRPCVRGGVALCFLLWEAAHGPQWGHVPFSLGPCSRGKTHTGTGRGKIVAREYQETVIKDWIFKAKSRIIRLDNFL